MLKIKTYALILSMSFTLNTYADDVTPTIVKENEGVDIVQVVKTIKAISNAFSSIGSIGGKPRKSKKIDYNQKPKTPEINGCAYAVKIQNDLVCKAKVEEVSNPLALIRKINGKIIISVHENIISQPHVYDKSFTRHFTKNFRNRTDYEMLAKFKGECRQRYFYTQKKVYTVEPLANYTFDYNNPDPQLFNNEYGSHNWPNLQDEVGNILCQANYSPRLTPNLQKKYNQFITINKTEAAVPKNSLDELKVFQIDFTSSYNNIRNQNLNPSSDELLILVDKTERLKDLKTFEGYDRLNQLRLKYLASKSCNRFARNIMRSNNGSILIAYCPKDSDTFPFSKHNFSNSKLVIIGTKGLSKVNYRDLGYEKRSLDMDLRNNYSLKLDSL